MVLIDTSVWISLYRKKETALGEHVWALTAKNEAAVCGQVWVEFLGGFKQEAERERFEKSFLAFPFLETPLEAYQNAARLLAHYRKLGAGDVIIAATAIESDCELLTLDEAFRPLAREGLRLFSLS